MVNKSQFKDSMKIKDLGIVSEDAIYNINFWNDIESKFSLIVENG